VATDADALSADMDSLGTDLNSLTQDISNVQGDIQKVQQDMQTLQSDGVAVPGSMPAAITAAGQAIASAKAKANQDITLEDADVVSGYQIANSLATGPCGGQGPGSPPSPSANI
jgi:hypothetical protein